MPKLGLILPDLDKITAYFEDFFSAPDFLAITLPSSDSIYRKIRQEMHGKLGSELVAAAAPAPHAWRVVGSAPPPRASAPPTRMPTPRLLPAARKMRKRQKNRATAENKENCRLKRYVPTANKETYSGRYSYLVVSRSNRET